MISVVTSEEESGLAVLAGARRQVDDGKGGQSLSVADSKNRSYSVINVLMDVIMKWREGLKVIVHHIYLPATWRAYPQVRPAEPAWR